METTRNGFDLAAQRELLEVMQSNPAAARVTLQTRHRWAGAGAIDGLAQTMDVGGECLPRRFTLRSDRPEVFGGRDTGPTPGELLLMALGACVASTYAEGAALQGVEIAELDAVVDASVDLRGAYGIDGVRVGLSSARIRLQVRSQAGEAVLEALGQAALRSSPVAASLTPSVPIEVSVQRAS
jgi:uncharacterized OsmC-like protein